MTTTHDKERQTDARRVDVAQRRNTGCYSHAFKIPLIYIILSLGYLVQVDFGRILEYSSLICRTKIRFFHTVKEKFRLNQPTLYTKKEKNCKTIQNYLFINMLFKILSHANFVCEKAKKKTHSTTQFVICSLEYLSQIEKFNKINNRRNFC